MSDILPISEGFHPSFAALVEHALQGDALAFEAAEMLWSAVHIVDDLIDKDRPVSDAEILGAVWVLMIGLRRNSFWLDHEAALQPLLENWFYAWIDANQFERGGNFEAAFSMRGALVDVYIKMAEITGGVVWMRGVSFDLREALFDDFSEYKAKCQRRDAA